MKKLFVLLILMLLLISTAAGVGCGDDDNSNSDSTNNAADTDTGDNSPDAGGDTGDDVGDDTGGGALSEVLTVNSGLYGSTTLEGPDGSGTFFLTVIGLSDHPNVCSAIPGTCDGSVTEEGTMLVLRLLTDEAQKIGRYDLGEFDEDARTPGAMVAKAKLDGLASGTSDDRVDITAGSIDVTAYDAQHIAGTYELTTNGAVETGSFDVDFCQALSDSLACD